MGGLPEDGYKKGKGRIIVGRKGQQGAMEKISKVSVERMNGLTPTIGRQEEEHDPCGRSLFQHT